VPLPQTTSRPPNSQPSSVQEGFDRMPKNLAGGSFFNWSYRPHPSQTTNAPSSIADTTSPYLYACFCSRMSAASAEIEQASNPATSIIDFCKLHTSVFFHTFCVCSGWRQTSKKFKLHAKSVCFFVLTEHRNQIDLVTDVTVSYADR